MKQMKQFIKWAIFLAVLAVVGRAIVIQFHAVSWQQVRFNWSLIALAAALVAAARLMAVFNYRHLLAVFGQRTPPAAWVAVAWAPQLGKYVPGKVASVAGAAWVLGVFNVPISVTTAIIFLLTGLSTAVGIVLSLPLTLWQPVLQRLPLGWLWCLALLVAGGVCLHPRIFRIIVAAVLKVLRRPMIPTPQKTAHYYRPLASILGQWILLGAAMWAVACSVADQSWRELPFCVSAQAMSAALGFLAFFAPAGLGVREGILLLLLNPTLGPGNAAIVVVAWRLLATLMDALLAAAGMFVLKRHLAAREEAQ